MKVRTQFAAFLGGDGGRPQTHPAGAVRARLRAIRALRWNYKRRGVWVWLKGRTCFTCGGKGKVIQCRITIRGSLSNAYAPGGFTQSLETCSRCNGQPLRGYQRILSEPEKVIAEQTALAKGVFA